MPTRPLPLAAILGAAVAALMAVGVFVFSPGASRLEHDVPSSTAPATPAAPAIDPPEPRAPALATPLPSTPAGGDATTSVAAAKFSFSELVRDGALLRMESRQYEAQGWETDLARALELPTHARLERRSGVYRVDGFKYPRVRVDRVYRLDRPGAATLAASSPGTSARRGASEKPPAAAATSSMRPAQGTGLLDAAGGEVVWENAMVADHLMVQVERGVTEAQLQFALPRGARVLGEITARGLYRVSVPDDGERSLERAVLALNRLPGIVDFAEPDFLIAGADTTPNDPRFTANASDLSNQWHLPRTMAPRAWDVVKAPKTTAISNQTVVAVVDTGIDFTHPDLEENKWTNVGETGGTLQTNGLDDDASGKVDDWQGWNFVEGNNNPMDDVGHGTHVAGIVGSVGNNSTGTSGVCWSVKIVALRIIKAQGGGTFGTYSDAVAAISYLQKLNQTGRRIAVANHSWGGNGYSVAMLNAINNPDPGTDPLPASLTSTYAIDVKTLPVSGTQAEVNKIKLGMTISGTGIPAETVVTIISGSTITISNRTQTARTNEPLTFSKPFLAKGYSVVHVAAAGNSLADVDRLPVYPACLPSRFIISVGATSNTNAEANWGGGAGTNFGRLNVDLFAPGSGIWSAKWTGGYESRNGTSMAAPQVAGAVALIRMWQPALTDLQARQVVIEQVTPLPALNSRCVSGGQLNIAKVIDRLYQPILVGSNGETIPGGDTTLVLSGPVGLTGQVAVSRFVSSVHVLAIHQGSIWAWGHSAGGQLAGNYSVGSTELAEPASYRPVQVAGIADGRMVAARGVRSYALRASGTVAMWGGGDGNGGNNNTPADIPGLTNVAWIAAGYAVKNDGTVWQFFDTQTPVTQVPVLAEIVMVADGDEHGLALQKNGTVWAWGREANGRLGNGQASPTATIETPFVVAGLPPDIRYVAAGETDSYAITENGSVYFWGKTPDVPQVLVPTLVPNLQGIASISASARNAVAITEDGQVLSWGRGYTGQLGSGSDTQTTPYSPALVVFPPDTGAALSCSAGGFVGGTVAILTEKDTVYLWGDNQYGALGQGEGQLRAFPTQIAPPGSFVELFTGDYSGFALDATANLYGWGTVQNFGPNSPTDLYGQSPQLLSTYPSFIKVDTSMNNRIGLTAGGEVWTWGFTPALVAGLAGAVDVSVAGGTSPFRLVALGDGTVRAWGENEAGQLGDGTTTDRIAPVPIPGLTSVASVHAAYRGDPAAAFSMAIRADGTVWAWGNNTSGQLGDGTTISRPTPGPVTGLTGVLQVVGATASFALKSDGSVWAWGSGYGLTPQPLAGLPPIVRMATSSPLFIGNDGRVWVLAPGMGPTEPAGPFPKPIVAISNVVRVEDTGGCVHALRADGSLWVWGQGLTSVGSLGDGLAWSNVPLRVIGFGGISTTLSTLGTGSTGSTGDSWLAQNFTNSELLDDAIVGDTASPSGDGIPNLLKYALGLNPKQRHDASSLPTVRIDLLGGTAQSTGIGLFSTPTVNLLEGRPYLVLSARRDGFHLDIDYVVEVSTDLLTWDSGDPHTVTVVDTAEFLEVYSAVSVEDQSPQFMRLKIRRK